METLLEMFKIAVPQDLRWCTCDKTREWVCLCVCLFILSSLSRGCCLYVYICIYKTTPLNNCDYISYYFTVNNEVFKIENISGNALSNVSFCETFVLIYFKYFFKKYPINVKCLHMICQLLFYCR